MVQRALAVAALAVVGLLLAGPAMFMHPATAYTGVRLRPSRALIYPNIVNVEPGSPAYRAGLRTGDAVSCLSRRDHTLLFQDLLVVPGSRIGYVPGTVLSLCVTRAGVRHNIRFVADSRPPAPNLYGSDGGSILRLAVYATFLVCGSLLVLGRPGRLTWLFFFFCVASGPDALGYFNLTVLPAPLYGFYLTLTNTLDLIAAGFLLLFTLLVPEDRARGWRLPAFRIACAATAAAAIANVLMLTVQGWAVAGIVPRAIEGALDAFTMGVIVARLMKMERDERARFGWAAFAIVWGLITGNLAHGAASIILPIFPHANIYAGMLGVVMPLAMMYGILKRHVIDIRFVLSRTAVYAVLTTVVVAIIGVIDWATSTYLHQARAAMALDAAVTIALALILHRAYGTLEKAVDFVLFKKKYEAETYLARLARSLISAEREETIGSELVNGPFEALDLSLAALYRREGSQFRVSRASGINTLDAPLFDADHELIRFLRTGEKPVRMQELRVGAGDLCERAASCGGHRAAARRARPRFRAVWLPSQRHRP